MEINAIGSQSHSYPMKRIPISILALLALFSLGSSLSGQEVVTEHVTLELVAENNALIPGQKNTVAVRLKMDDHWHTYWANPGDSGLPTEIAWTLPEGITAGPIQWPAPQWIDYFEMVSYAYEGEVFLLVDLEVPGGFEATGQVDLAARVDFLVCKEACIPGGADLTLSLPITASDDGWTDLRSMLFSSVWRLSTATSASSASLMSLTTCFLFLYRHGGLEILHSTSSSA